VRNKKKKGRRRGGGANRQVVIPYNSQNTSFLVRLGLGRLGPLHVASRGASDKLVSGLDNTLAQWRKLLERSGSKINLVRRTSSAVINNADNDGAFAGSDFGALETSCLLTALVVAHVDGTDHPAVAGVDV
jgi:hypothetical protein